MRRIITIQRCFRERRQRRQKQALLELCRTCDGALPPCAPETVSPQLPKRIRSEHIRDRRWNDHQQDDQVDKQVECPSCQTQTLSNANFCHRCGVSLRAAASSCDWSRSVRRQRRHSPSGSVHQTRSAAEHPNRRFDNVSPGAADTERAQKSSSPSASETH